MTAINSTGFDPDIHLTEPSKAAAKVRSTSFPGMALSMTKAGLEWAEKLMEERPYYKERWTIERAN